MNNSTARETLLLSVGKKRQGFTSYSADNADDDYYHKLVCCCAALIHTRCVYVCVCVCVCVQVCNSSPCLFVWKKATTYNNDTRLILQLHAYFSPSTLALCITLMYSCTQPLISQCFLQHTMSTDALVVGPMHITEDNCLCIFPHVCSLLSLASSGLVSSASCRTINRN